MKENLSIKDMSPKEMKDFVSENLDKQLRDPKKFASTIKLVFEPDKRAILAKYSLSNAFLLLSQNSNISELKTYGGWKKEGVSINKGEKALWAVAPMKLTSDPEHRKHPELCSENCECKYIRFKKISLFDISQTSLKDKAREILGQRDLTDYDELNKYLQSQKPYMYEEYYAKSKAEAMGFTNMNKANKSVTINVAYNQDKSDLALTLLHEFGHYSLNHLTDEKGYQGHVRGVKETEAEMYAMLAGTMLGISNEESIENSAAYITSWNNETNQKEPLKVFEHVSSVLRNDFKDMLDKPETKKIQKANILEEPQISSTNEAEMEPQE